MVRSIAKRCVSNHVAAAPAPNKIILRDASLRDAPQDEAEFWSSP
jgi:hypothetical protein